MFNPDSPNEKKNSPATDSSQHGGVVTMSEKQKMRFYILEGGMASCYGFRLTHDKRLEIADRNKLLRFDDHLRSILREIYEELKK